MSQINVSMPPIGQWEPGMIVEGFLICRQAAIKVSSNKNKYLDIQLSDYSGEISCKKWDVSGLDMERITPGKVVKVRGQVGEYMNRMQLTIEKIRPLHESDTVDMTCLIPTAPDSPQNMWETVARYTGLITNQEIRVLVERMLAIKRDDLMFYPAAKALHHAIYGGLLQHITTMLVMAETALTVYDFLNADLLYAGIILHDLAKIGELNADETGTVSDYTTEGMLIGHLVSGVMELALLGRELGTDRETLLLLQHMVLSHHNEPDFGSPKRPMFPEAEMLHMLDLMDARLYEMNKALERITPGGFSERQWALHDRKLYKRNE